MEKLTHDNLLTMMQLQDELNTRINIAWKEEKYPWMRAAWVESAKLIDHIGWKWWKHQEPNWVQAHIELVDIWHFMLSEWIGNVPNDEDLDSAAHVLLESMYSPEKWTQAQEDALARHTDLKILVDSFAHLCSANVFNVKIFERIMELTGMSWTMMYRMYVAKNVLNTFHQEHGYKEGTYIKTWDGHEDNVYLEAVMESDPLIKPAELRSALLAKYLTVKQKVADERYAHFPQQNQAGEDELS